MAGPTTLFQTGIHSARPAASSGCVLYSCTTHGLIYKSDGASWTTFLTLTAAGAVGTDSIWDAAGDLAVGSGADMAAKLSIGATNGMALRRVSGAVAWDLPPGHEFTYDEFTSPVNITATSEGAADTVKASSAVTYDGSTVVWIEFWVPYVQNPSGNHNVVLVLLEDSTVIGLGALETSEGASNNQRAPGVMIRRRRTPSNASHTYTVKAYVDSGTGIIGVGAGGSGAYLPGYVRVVKA